MTIAMIVLGVVLFIVGVGLIIFLIVRRSGDLSLPEDEIDADVGWPNDGDI